MGKDFFFFAYFPWIRAVTLHACQSSTLGTTAAVFHTNFRELNKSMAPPQEKTYLKKYQNIDDNRR